MPPTRPLLILAWMAVAYAGVLVADGGLVLGSLAAMSRAARLYDVHAELISVRATPRRSNGRSLIARRRTSSVVSWVALCSRSRCLAGCARSVPSARQPSLTWSANWRESHLIGISRSPSQRMSASGSA